MNISEKMEFADKSMEAFDVILLTRSVSHPAARAMALGKICRELIEEENRCKHQQKVKKQKKMKYKYKIAAKRLWQDVKHYVEQLFCRHRWESFYFLDVCKKCGKIYSDKSRII